MSFWIARDRAGYLKVFSTKPEFIHNRYWKNDEGDGRQLATMMPKSWWETLFDNVTFENSPVEVELNLKLK